MNGQTPGNDALHDNVVTKKDEALSYIAYSAKELLYLLNQKVESLDDKFDLMAIELAKLPNTYVTRTELAEMQRQQTATRRFAIGSVIASVGSLGTFIGMIFNVVT